MELLREHKKLKLVNAAETTWNTIGFIKEWEISETQFAELLGHYLVRASASAKSLLYIS
jgi:hypothetical protein